MMVRWISVWLLVSSLAGCGGAPAGPDVVPVSGVVTLDEQPLPDARITFLPEDKGSNAATGTTDAEGKYVLSQATAIGAIPGPYKVIIEVYRQKDGKPVPEEMKGDVLQLVAMGSAVQTLPKKYSDPEATELRKEVELTETKIDFELKSK